METTSTSESRSTCRARAGGRDVELVRRPAADPVIDQQRRTACRSAGADQAEHLLDLCAQPVSSLGQRGYADERSQFVWWVASRTERSSSR